MEIGFISYVVRPLFAVLVRLAPDLEQTLMTRLNNNQKMWERIRETQKGE